MGQNDADVDEMARDSAVGTEEEQRVDGVERQPGDDEHDHDDGDAVGRPSLAGGGRRDGRTVPRRPNQRLSLLHDGRHRHHL